MVYAYCVGETVLKHEVAEKHLIMFIWQFGWEL